MALEDITQSADKKERAQPHPLFFNVMPAAKGGLFSTPAKTITPLNNGDSRVAVTPGESGTISSADMPSPRSNSKLKYFIIPIIILLIAGAAYALWLLKQGNPTTDEQAAIKPPGAAAKGTTETNTDTKKDTVQITTTPKEWLLQYFGSNTCKQENTCGDSADPDRDGLTNKEEFTAETDPNNVDCDKDGLADGDEVEVFGSDPSRARTAGDIKYNDADYAKGGYDTITKALFTSSRFSEVKSNMRSHGLHQPTLTTMGDTLLEIYGFSGTETDAASPQIKGAALPSGIDASPEAKLDRDSQRLVTIKKIGVALVKYKSLAGTGKYPETADFTIIADKIKPYLTSATNVKDPIDKDPFKYSYIPGSNGGSFVLTYYSETQNQLIRYQSVTAELEAKTQGAVNNDEQRKADIETIYSALLIYSANKSAPDGFGGFIFPTSQNYKTELSPVFITSIPKDPVTGKDYEYKVSENLNTFTLKAVLENPASGTTGYMCNQEECREY